MLSANLGDADLNEANLSGAKGLTQHQINEAQGNKETKLPQGLQTPEHWLKDSPSQ